MEKAGLERSMSKKGCSLDNAACEALFGRLKNEMFYCRIGRVLKYQSICYGIIQNELKHHLEI